MRLDKFLKVSRIIKRRTIANQACDSEKIVVNNKIAKASLNLKVGDVIEIKFKNKILRVEVLSLDEIAEKKNSSSMYKIIAEENNG
ncbi:MAG: RNA-binding S4 domain-containing protein [Firmicutes bacterium]|nr:RNA-binding S4 domain-containing protein [Bacillota bacterium]